MYICSKSQCAKQPNGKVLKIPQFTIYWKLKADNFEYYSDQHRSAHVLWCPPEKSLVWLKRLVLYKLNARHSSVAKRTDWLTFYQITVIGGDIKRMPLRCDIIFQWYGTIIGYNVLCYKYAPSWYYFTCVERDVKSHKKNNIVSVYNN